MILLYGIVRRDGFAIGDNTEKIFLGRCTRQHAAAIITDEKFIEIWNAAHRVEIIQLIFETEV